MRRVATIRVDDAAATLIVTGSGTPQPGAHTRLAIRVADVARALGFRTVGLRCSHLAISNARYVTATDAAGHVWEVRVANHHRPEGSYIPHLDLISVDGDAGLDDVREFLALVADGAVTWFDSTATAVVAPRKSTKRIARCR